MVYCEAKHLKIRHYNVFFRYCFVLKLYYKIINKIMKIRMKLLITLNIINYAIIFIIFYNLNFKI